MNVTNITATKNTINFAADIFATIATTKQPKMKTKKK
jgi:hypothetical protein